MAKILPGQTDIYALTDSRLSLGRPVEEVALALLEAGIKILQYREKKLPKAQMLAECQTLRNLTRQFDACFIVNDYPELALSCEADGIHIGQDDLPPKAVRQLAGNNMIIGLSTHSPAQALQAQKEPVDYIGVGPIFATRTKEDVCAPVGFAYLDWVVQNSALPFVAIGGIKAHNIAEVAAHGAHCCALVSELVGAKDIGRKVRETRTAMARGMTEYRAKNF